jgi:hypothetical protein
LQVMVMMIVMEGIRRKQGGVEREIKRTRKKKVGAKKAVTDMGMVRCLEVRRRIRDY